MAIFRACPNTPDYPYPVQDKGVRYALGSDGLIVRPEEAARLSRVYLCLDCNEHVYLRKGNVRQPHFAHYTDRQHPCSAETITHEAAKHKLVELMTIALVGEVRSQAHVGGWFDLVKVEYAARFPSLPHRSGYYSESQKH